MVLIGDIVGDDDDAVAAAASQVVRIANARGGEGFIAVVGRGAQALLARPRAHRGDRQAHQRVQDQRGRGHPARRASATTPTASSASTSSCRSQNKLELLDALGRILRGRPAAPADAWPPDERRRADAAGACSTRKRRGRRAATSIARACAQRWQRPAPTRHRRRRLPRAAGPHDARVVEARCATPLRGSSTGARSSRC